MLIKIVIVFLGAMAIVGMVGTAVYKRVQGRNSSAKNRSVFCAKCGRPQLGRAPCACKG